MTLEQGHDLFLKALAGNNFSGESIRAYSADLTQFVEFLGTHLRRDTVIPQWFQASKAAAASDGHAVHC